MVRTTPVLLIRAFSDPKSLFIISIGCLLTGFAAREDSGYGTVSVLITIGTEPFLIGMAWSLVLYALAEILGRLAHASVSLPCINQI